MKKLPLAVLVSFAFAAGAALAQSTGNSGSDSGSTGMSSGGSTSSTGSSYGSDSNGVSGSDNSSAVQDTTSSSGTSSAYDGTSQHRHVWNKQGPSADIIRHNAGGGLPAGELSTPWQDTGGEAGSQAQ